MSNTDNHRLLHGTLVTVAKTPEFVGNDDADVREVWFARNKKLEVGTKFACVEFTRHGPKPQVDMDTLPVTIHFGIAQTARCRRSKAWRRTS